MMTDKPDASSKRKPRKAKADAKKGGVLEITVPNVSSLEETRKYLEENFPDWSKLGQLDKDRLAELMFKNRKAANPVRVTLTRQPSGLFSIDPVGDGPTAILSILKLMDAFSATGIDTVNARSSDLIKYLDSVGACSEGKYNAALAFVESMAPQDQAQAQLLVQAYVTHDAAIRALSQLGSAEWLPNMTAFGNLANKLLNTYTKQMDTLMRMQRGNEQVVKHVYVDNRGGQAVFAQNVAGGGSGAEGRQQPYATTPIDGSAPLLGSDPFGSGMPIPGGVGPEAMPDARWEQPRSADRQGERELPARGPDEGGYGRAA